MKRFIFLLSLLLFVPFIVQAEPEARKATNASVHGKITSEGRPISYAVVSIKGTAIGTASDGYGHYELRSLPLGNITIVVTYMGYRTVQQQLTIEDNSRIEQNFDLQVDQLEMDAVVVTGDKNAINRREASTIVSSMSPKLLSRLQTTTISEGVNFIPGVRMENNCQNCGFNQVRLNGMEGAYSQILIDGHPIFSGLANVYGMELIPANMIGSLEVVRGGGSALYGSNAIAGTINVRLRDPLSDAFEVGYNYGFNGLGAGKGTKWAPNQSVSLNASAVSTDGKAGLAIYGFYRNRMPVDLNADEFSDLPHLKNTTIGSRAFYRFTDRAKLTGTYFHISESRRGGDRHDMPDHIAHISESLKHGIHSGSLMYSQYFRDEDELDVSVSAQSVDRNSYYGGYSLEDYGTTKDRTWNALAQYTVRWETMDLVAGIDFTQSFLKDSKPKFWDLNWFVPPVGEQTVSDQLENTEHDGTTIADQGSNTVGIFAQYTWKHPIVNITVGARFDHYTVKNNLKQEEKLQVTKDSTSKFVNAAPTQISGNMPVPRVNFLFKLMPELQLRVNYAMGYRAPQLFNEDLHVETKAEKRVFRTNDGDLKSELSHCAMLSVDYNQQFDHQALGVLVEGFYNYLQNAFIEDMEDFDNNIVVATRSNNANGAFIAGMNMEVNYAPLRNLTMKLGLTYQKSRFMGDVEDSNFGVNEFMRTPDLYGFFLMDWKIYGGLSFSPTFYLTGPMTVPYDPASASLGIFNGDEKAEYIKNSEDPKADDPEGGFVLRKSPTFADLGFKLSYTFNLNSMSLQTFIGMKNVFNSFQKDLEVGADRASAYVYGPSQPRMLYMGIKLGNIF